MRDRAVPTPHGEVPVRRWGDSDADIGVLVAHGAGAGQDHPWMAAMAERLAAAGYPTWTFDYAYVAAGRKAPDRLPRLLDVHEVVAADVNGHVERLILAGKSMGGRVGGHLVAEGRASAAGLVFFGYPLVPLGAAEPRDTSHLVTLGIPQLFVSGTRDRMGPLDRLRPTVAAIPTARLVEVDDGDHSLVPRKASGRTLDDSLDEAVAAVDAWATGEVLA